MSTNPLDSLLEKLTSGDAQAAEKVFLAYEPYLRMVVRRHLSPALRASSILWILSSRFGLICCAASASRAGGSPMPFICGRFWSG